MTVLDEGFLNGYSAMPQQMGRRPTNKLLLIVNHAPNKDVGGRGGGCVYETCRLSRLVSDSLLTTSFTLIAPTAMSADFRCRVKSSLKCWELSETLPSHNYYRP